MTCINWQERARKIDLSVSNFIDGIHECCLGINEPIITKHSPRDANLLYQFAPGSGSEVNRAVSSARAAFTDGRWRELPVAHRKAVLQKLADLIEKNKEELALYECLDVGKPINCALTSDVPQAASALRTCAESADKLLAPSGVNGAHFAYQLRKPIGVIGGIVGWNYPLCLAISKLGPALAMGNSLVLKPSEFTALSTTRLATLAFEAGIPPGIFNVVHGTGATVGATLASHNDVDLLTFTGSSATGKQMMVAAGHSNMKRLILECGGKSPYLVFDDCPDDLDFIAADVAAKAFSNQGAVCISGSRLLIQQSVKNRLLPKILEQAAMLTPQDPLNPKTTFGALINEAHMNKVLNFIESGKKEGAKLIYGGKRVHTKSGGYYIEPTVFDCVNPQQKIAREEIFGPVLSIFTFKDDEEAIQIANNTRFGLAAYVATENLGRAQRLGQFLNAGLVVIAGSSTPSGGGVDIGMEGHKESGFGTEGGLPGLAAYTISTSVHVKT